MDGEQYASEDVTVLGEKSHKDAPQNLDCLTIPCRTFSGQCFQRHLLSPEMCAQHQRWECRRAAEGGREVYLHTEEEEKTPGDIDESLGMGGCT
jgi:hypothetical protein